MLLRWHCMDARSGSRDLATANRGGEDDERGRQKHLEQMDTPNRNPCFIKDPGWWYTVFCARREGGHNEAAELIEVTPVRLKVLEGSLTLHMRKIMAATVAEESAVRMLVYFIQKLLEGDVMAGAKWRQRTSFAIKRKNASYSRSHTQKRHYLQRIPKSFDTTEWCDTCVENRFRTCRIHPSPCYCYGL